MIIPRPSPRFYFMSEIVSWLSVIQDLAGSRLNRLNNGARDSDRLRFAKFGVIQTSIVNGDYRRWKKWYLIFT